MTSNHRIAHVQGLLPDGRGVRAHERKAPLRRELLACTALLTALMVPTALPAWAAGGAGGSAGVNSGGVGGSAGGFSGSAGGGLFGAPGGTGGNSAADVPAAGPGGGGGGGGGFNGNGAGQSSITNSGTLAGTNGGKGGAGPSAGTGGGGGGGEGGYGAIVTGNGTSSSNSGTISGGSGGAGGVSGSAAGNFGGNGGDGGIGVVFTGTSASFINSGTVSGGMGGAGGAAVGSGSAGSPGAGGAGIVGSGLTITNSGTIMGGFAGDNTTRANAITFTGGANVLELQSGSIIAGNVVDSTGNGTLRLGGSTSSSFDASTIGPSAQYRGFSTFVKTGTSTWTLGGMTTALTPWTVNQGTLAISSDGSLGNVAGALTLDGGTLQILSVLTMNRDIVLGAGGGTLFTVGSTGTLAGTISGGNLTKTGVGTIAITGTSNYTGTTTISLGTLQAGSTTAFSSASAYTIMSGGVLDLNGFNETVASVAGAGNITLGAGTLTTGGDNTSTTLSGHISGAGGLTKVGTGTFTLSGTTSYSGATNVNTGVLQAGAAGVFSPSSAFAVAGGATLDLNNFDQSIGSLAGAGSVTLGSARLTTGSDNTSTTFLGTITGTGGLTKEGTGIFTVSSPNAYTGATNVNTGTFQAGATNVFAPASAFTVASGATLDLNGFDQSVALLAGAGTVSLGTATLTTGSGNASTTFSGDITGTGGLVKDGTGTFTLSGPSAYIGNTTVNNGTLLVDGSIASSSVIINSGAILGGNGTVGSTTINSGGTLSPGNGGIGTIAVNGTLALNPGSSYVVEVSPAAADKTAVSGTAALGGTAQVNFQGGTYAPKSYTILTSAGLGGTTFDTVTMTGTPSGFSADVAYTTTDALLNLTATLGKGQGLSQNQQNVANALNSFFNGGGTLPPEFLDIYGQSGNSLKTSLTLLSGEPVAQAQQAAFQMMNGFLGIMLDPFVGRSESLRNGGGALGFAPERTDAAVPSEIALGYSAAKSRSRAMAQATPSFGQRWSVWGAGFGGVKDTDGDAGTGSHDTAVSTYGVAVGADYQISPNALAGVAISGGGTRWDVVPGLGGGSSDVFQAGVYGVNRSGPLYVATSMAFANHWMQTERSGPGGDRLAGNFTAQSFGGRIEAGHRYEKSYGTITPYIAGQAASFSAPGYAETDRDRGPFALTYNSRSAYDIRSELGARLQSVTPLASGQQLVMHSRLAWAHDWISDPAITADMQALPGASFTVTGAAPATDSILTSAGFEVRMPSGISLLTKFEGEFASRSASYGGTGTLRYHW